MGMKGVQRTSRLGEMEGGAGGSRRERSRNSTMHTAPARAINSSSNLSRKRHSAAANRTDIHTHKAIWRPVQSNTRVIKPKNQRRIKRPALYRTFRFNSTFNPRSDNLHSYLMGSARLSHASSNKYTSTLAFTDN